MNENAFLRSVRMYGHAMWGQGHSPDQCFTAMQPTIRQHSQSFWATGIGPGLLNYAIGECHRQLHQATQHAAHFASEATKEFQSFMQFTA